MVRENSSFRDKSGFVFRQNGVVFRQVNKNYKDDYDHLMGSGLYHKLVSAFFLVAHEEQTLSDFEQNESVYKILKPEPIRFISYPYSWSFSMLKDAAILTLEVQKIALAYGMVLKDASAYNVQFIGSSPIFIDTLSFEKHKIGSPWAAYRQYCQHFLSPLALMAYTDVSLSKLLTSHLDGIPLQLTAKLLPLKSVFNIGLCIHIFLHARVSQKYNSQKVPRANSRFTIAYFKSLTENLLGNINRLKWLPVGTEWEGYYNKSVGDAYLKEKERAIRGFFSRLDVWKVLDLGANDGTFSKIAKEYCDEVLSFDIDPACVERNYLRLRASKNLSILPLIFDITNPEPGIGWLNRERKPLFERMENVDTVMALALIHHLCISNNLPLENVATFFVRLACKHLIIEFVPKTDGKVQLLLMNREDIFEGYTLEKFLEAFKAYFIILDQQKILPTERVLFLMEKIQHV